MLATNEQEYTPGKDAACSYTIEQVAALTGLTRRTLRYYEEVGLLPPTDRTAGNYRRYSDEDVRRLERIKKLRDLLGFALADIREILEGEDERGVLREAFRHESGVGAKIAQLDRGDELIRKQLQLIEQKIEGLEQMRASLLQQIEQHALKRRALQEQDSQK
jgi:MerR family transcriptional regulator, repressor of the yfmOP operon